MFIKTKIKNKKNIKLFKKHRRVSPCACWPTFWWDISLISACIAITSHLTHLVFSGPIAG